VLFHKTPEVRLCRRQWHLRDDEFVPSLVALEQHVFISVFAETYAVGLGDITPLYLFLSAFSDQSTRLAFNVNVYDPLYLTNNLLLPQMI